jgi:phytoene synthase
MRFADDVVDEDRTASPATALELWESALDAVFASGPCSQPGLAALRDTVERFNLPRFLFDELIVGVRADLEPVRFDAFDDLERYCYRVAGVVGLICLRIWGVLQDANAAEADRLARACGTAFQLTNILRDIREDADRGRLYLPIEDLRAFDLEEAGLLAPESASGACALIRFEAERATVLYDASRPLAAMIAPDSRATFLAMYLVYRHLLERIRDHPEAVLRGRVGLSPSDKLAVVAKALYLARRPDPTTP